MARMLIIALLMVAAPLQSVEYQDFEEYQDSKWYKRGQVVKWRHHLWVARWPTKARSPDGYSYYWSKVDLAGADTWHRGRFYRQGKVVSIQGVYYLSKRAGFIEPGGFMSSFQWMDFSHPAIGYDLPIVDFKESKTVLEGFDSNFNGIRDDYEVTVIMTAENEAQRNFGLNAAITFRKQFEIGLLSVDEVSEEFAATTMNKLIEISFCLRKLRKSNYQFSGFKHKYFNTIDRLRVFKKADSNFFRLLGNEYEPTISEFPCKHLLVAEDN